MIIIIIFTCVFHTMYATIKPEENPFCQTMCKEENVACERAPCRLEPQFCKHPSNILRLTRFQRSFIFEEHNRLRNNLAGGLDKHINYTVANMKGLSYSMELEFLAQCAANLCPHSEDKCRATPVYDLVSQNIHFSDAIQHPTKTSILKEAVKEWYEAGILDLKNSKTIRNKVSIPGTKSTAILFYFQAEKMGCGRVRNEKRVIIVCNYAPGLDVGAGSIYLQGRPCSGCRHENCGAIYGNLCGKIVIEKPSDYKPPFVLGTAYRLDVINIVLLVASQFIAFTYL